MKLVAISGWKRSGKDTVAEHLIKNHGAHRIGFADPLKEMVTDLFGVSRETIDNPDTKEAPLLHMPVLAKDGFSANVNKFLIGEYRHADGSKPVESMLEKSVLEANHTRQLYWTPRSLCIMIGSSMRSVQPNFWVDKALRQMTEGKLYVISDVRYKNEMDTIEERIKNHVSLRINRFDTCESQDPSERDLDNYPFDIILRNKSTVDELLQTVDSILFR